jgi:hypothetical protein
VFSLVGLSGRLVFPSAGRPQALRVPVASLAPAVHRKRIALLPAQSANATSVGKHPGR